jgi:hypothetical protein
MKAVIVIKKIYLYVATLIGLVMLIIGCANFINMGLKAYVFTQADEQYKLESERPPYEPRFLEEKRDVIVADSETVTVELTKEEKYQLQQFFEEYDAWEERNETLDVIKTQRHRTAATNLSLILVGLPVYLYHWMIVRRKKDEV